jgi:hypothetical protein
VGVVADRTVLSWLIQLFSLLKTVYVLAVPGTAPVSLQVALSARLSQTRLEPRMTLYRSAEGPVAGPAVTLRFTTPAEGAEAVIAAGGFRTSAEADAEVATDDVQ